MNIGTWMVVGLLGHFIGDYYCQNDALAERKRTSYGGTAIHALLYCLPFFTLGAICWFSFRFSPWRMILAVVLVHLAIDAAKCSIERHVLKKPCTKRRNWLYLVDQILHVLTIWGVGYFMRQGLAEFPIVPDKAMHILRWSLCIAILLKPVNITFKEMFKTFQSASALEEDSVMGAGAVIGSMERILMVLLISLNQYAAIGLVMTAKSITRFKRIGEDRTFAEYYLIGTLYSVIATLIVYLVIFQPMDML